jgi:SNF2 family DNA or RNA helicase
LEDILTEAGGEPVVVFTRFVQDLNTVESLAAKLGLKYGEISGRRKDGINDIATMTEGLQVVGVEEEAGGAGIDLSRARLVVDYSPSWKLAVYEQKLARVHRPPQNQPVIVYQLVAEDSIDEEVYRALQARRAVIGQAWRSLETTEGKM